MDLQRPCALLGGLSPSLFMRRHWQRRPLLVRQAIAGVEPPVSRSELFKLAASDDVESRLVVRHGREWTVRHGPLARRALPPVHQGHWTLLVQGLDLHVAAAHRLLAQFRFVSDARLDDLMMSWASDGGGVGPHLDSYDVFLIQVHGKRRWRIGRTQDEAFVDGLPLKILRHFEPEQTWILEPGDMLYLPPRWAHDGVAVGECMTCSVGFRAPAAGELASDLAQRLGDAALENLGHHYRDAGATATLTPAAIPAALRDFSRRALEQLLTSPDAIDRALGESLTEPKPRVWFPRSELATLERGVRLAAGTRMMYDERHVYINGESFRVSGRDARCLRALADRRELDGPGCAGLGAQAGAILLEWVHDGWLQMRST